MAVDAQFHVLAVDDSLIDRKLIERLLKSSSFEGKLRLIMYILIGVINCCFRFFLSNGEWGLLIPYSRYPRIESRF